MCIFVFRVIMLSASYADALCLVALLAYHFGDKFVKAKNISQDVLSKLESNAKMTEAKLDVMGQEVHKVRSVVDMLKTTSSFLNKK